MKNVFNKKKWETEKGKRRRPKTCFIWDFLWWKFIFWSPPRASKTPTKAKLLMYWAGNQRQQVKGPRLHIQGLSSKGFSLREKLGGTPMPRSWRDQPFPSLRRWKFSKCLKRLFGSRTPASDSASHGADQQGLDQENESGNLSQDQPPENYSSEA